MLRGSPRRPTGRWSDTPLGSVTSDFWAGRRPARPAARAGGGPRARLRGAASTRSGPNGVLVEQHMAGEFGLVARGRGRGGGAAGWRRLTVRGIVLSPEYMWPARSRQEMFVLPEDFGVMFAPAPLVAGLHPTTVHRESLACLGPARPRRGPTMRPTRCSGAGAIDVMTRAEQPSNAALQEDVSGFGELACVSRCCSSVRPRSRRSCSSGAWWRASGADRHDAGNGASRRMIVEPLHRVRARGRARRLDRRRAPRCHAGRRISSLYTGELGIPSR